MRYLLLFLLCATPVSAQPLADAMKAFAVASVVDNAQTFASLQRGNHEASFYLQLGHNKPVPTVMLNIGADVAISAAFLRLGRTHPKLAITGLVGVTTLRMFTIRHNFTTLRYGTQAKFR